MSKSLISTILRWLCICPAFFLPAQLQLEKNQLGHHLLLEAFLDLPPLSQMPFPALSSHFPVFSAAQCLLYHVMLLCKSVQAVSCQGRDRVLFSRKP